MLSLHMKSCDRILVSVSKAWTFAYGTPVRGSLYLARWPVIAQVSCGRPRIRYEWIELQWRYVHTHWSALASIHPQLFPFHVVAEHCRHRLLPEWPWCPFVLRRLVYNIILGHHLSALKWLRGRGRCCKRERLYLRLWYRYRGPWLCRCRRT